MRVLENTEQLNFKKGDGLIPVIIQDENRGTILMLGYMNQEAVNKTLSEKWVTFYSRSKKRLWTKGEESGNYLEWKEILFDCDADTLLIKVNPLGPTCHTGSQTCFNESNDSNVHFLDHLTNVIKTRRTESSKESYTASLFEKGLNKIAQKVGEEAVELVIEAKDEQDELFKNEAADLLFHYMVLLEAKGYSLSDITAVLESRHK